VRVPGRKTMGRCVRWLRSRFVSGALILGYHRVAQTAQDPFGMCVSPEHFRQHLEALSRYAHPARLQMVARALPDDAWPRRSVVLTFDDGYADLLEVKPLLAHYQVPATVFVASGSMGGEFWWDELERIILSAHRLPEHLSLRVDGGVWEWEPGGVVSGERADRAAQDRLRLLQALYRLLRSLSPTKRQQAMDQLDHWAGIGKDRCPASRALADDELIELANGDLIEIGAHSVTHSSLADLPASEQREEIGQSKERLEALLGRPVTAFSYPNGSSSVQTRELVRNAGFACACASQNDVVWQGSDRFALPRFWIPDCDGAAFARWLRRWLGT
jgi:peptidoglycan/xylan/chitin deacetylase (PgdA/CDA1 family)